MFNNKMMFGVVTPTTTGTTTVVTTTTSSGAYANLSTSTTTSLPSTCPGIVHSRQISPYFKMEKLTVEVKTAAEFCIRNCKEILEEIESVDSRDKINDMNNRLIEKNAKGCMDDWESELEKLEAQVEEECIKIGDGGRQDILHERLLNCKEIMNCVRIAAKDFHQIQREIHVKYQIQKRLDKEGLCIVEQASPGKVSEAGESCGGIPQVLALVPQDAVQMQQVQASYVPQVETHEPQVVQHSILNDEMDSVNDLENKLFPQMPNKITVDDDDDLQLIDNDDDLQIMDKDDIEMIDLRKELESFKHDSLVSKRIKQFENGIVECNNISEIERIDVNEKFSESEKEDLVNRESDENFNEKERYDNSDVDADSVISNYYNESDLSKEQVEPDCDKKSFKVSEKEIKDQQEKLLQDQVRKIRVGVLKLVQTCLGQIISNDEFSNQHRSNYKWQNSWKGSLPEFWHGSVSLTYGI